MAAEILTRKPSLSQASLGSGNDASLVSAKTASIVFFTHPVFAGHVSLPRFSSMLVEGMKKRGHQVEVLSPKPRFFNLPLTGSLKKWLGYVDQYILFPIEVRSKLKSLPKDTLFVFTDNALGPWVPLVADLPHVIHCHDFMAQQSALGQIPDSPTRWTGRQYQKLIYQGYCKGKNFISGSQNTRSALRNFLPTEPTRSEIVYNGLHQSFQRFDINGARKVVGKEFGLDLSSGYLLHVGGNQWYKNRVGVISMYDSWRSSGSKKLPLILIGLPPSTEIKKAFAKSPFRADIHFITNASDKIINLAYSGASVFLFPSKAEGFGWPIAEAMASGCPVITTNVAPMTEVTGNAGFLLPKCPQHKTGKVAWSKIGGRLINKVINLSYGERETAVRAGIENAKRFDTDVALDKIEEIYLSILLD